MGPWGIAALLAVASVATETGRTLLKKAVKAGFITVYMAKDAVAEFADKGKQSFDEILSEVKDERLQEEHAEEGKSKKKAKAAAHNE